LPDGGDSGLEEGGGEVWKGMTQAFHGHCRLKTHTVAQVPEELCEARKKHL